MSWDAHEAEQIGRIESTLNDCAEHLKDHETRLRAGERWRNALAGAWAVLAFIGAGLFRSLWSKLS